MTSFTQEKQEQIHTLLSDASNIFLQLLGNQKRPGSDFIAGMEKLLYATDLAKNWNERVQTCPSCGCIYSRLLDRQHAQCLSCDREWETQAVDTGPTFK